MEHDSKSESLSPTGKEAGHEISDVRVAGIVWFMIALTVGIVFVGWLMIGLFDSLESRAKEAEVESRPSPFAAQRPKLPPEPRLQLAPESEKQIENKQPPDLRTQQPVQEMKELRDRWDNELQQYGWVNEKEGVVRIPIGSAKKLLLQRGLPTRAAKKEEQARPPNGGEGKQ